METFKKQFLLTLGCVSLTVLVFLLSFFLFLYNPRFYDWEYHKNVVYDEFGYNETWNATHELWGYMQFNGEFTSDFFSSRDQRHMIDVRNIIAGTEYVFFFACVVFLLVSLYFFSFHRKEFPLFLQQLFFYSGFLCFLVLGIFGVLALFFERSFVLFHELFFTNDFWMLNPAVDKLVVLYPENFFLMIFAFILGLALVFAVVLLVLSWCLKRKIREKNI